MCRLLVVGKSGSGKSNALHRLTRAALSAPWSAVLLADGKGAELPRYTSPTRVVYGPGDAEACAAALDAAAERMGQRYAALTARGLTAALPGEPRELIIIDEVQVFTRHPQHGKVVRAALVRIFEQSGALGDLVIVTSQRAANAIPPSARVNASAELRMLGAGYYQLAADGHPTRQGRVDLAAPTAGVEALTPADLPLALGARPPARAPTPIVRYEGVPGSGRSYALGRHQADPAYRRVALDCKAHTHRSLLIACLQECGATPPDGALITELAEAAALALAARPTLLLLDNCEYASVKTIDSLHRLLDAASAAAIGMTPAGAGDPAKDRLTALRRRAQPVALQPLDAVRAAALLAERAPAIDAAAQATILQRAHGHPQTIVAYAERVAAHGDDERHALESFKKPARWLNIVFMFGILVAVIMIQRQISNDLAGAVLSGAIIMTMWFLRPRFREATKK